jgi:O-antigen/teichoic acid export membrane protein
LIRRRVLTATLTNWSTKVVTLVIRFFLTPFILHRLGDTQFGLLALVGSVVGQGELLDLGIKAALMKYVAEHHSQEKYIDARRLIATSFLLYCGLGLLALLLALAIAPIFPHLFNVPPSDRATAIHVVQLMGIQIAIAVPGAAPAAVLWGLHRYALVNALIILSTVLSAALTVAILLAGGGVTEMVAAGIPLALGMLVVGIGLLNRVAPELRSTWRDARRELAHSVLSFSGATFIIQTGFSLLTKVDEIIIGAFLPISSVSPYTIARRLSAMPQMVTEPCLGAFLPVASQLQAEGDANRLRSFYLIGSRITLAICLPLASVLIALAGPLLALWVGAEYSAYAPIVIILALAGLAEISHWPANEILQGTARHHGLAPAYLVAAVANITVSVLLVRPYGLVGVAMGTLIPSTVLSLCYVWPYASRVLGVPWRDLLKQVFWPVVLPVVPMGAVIYVATRIIEPSGLISLLVIASASLSAYAAVYLAVGAGDPERQLIRNVLANARSAASFR